MRERASVLVATRAAHPVHPVHVAPAARVADAAFAYALDHALSRVEPFAARGRVTEVSGGVIKATGLACSLGELCTLHDRNHGAIGQAEVIGFAGNTTFLTPIGRVRSLSPHVDVVPCNASFRIGVSNALIGRVLDGFGEPIDGGGPIATDPHCRDVKPVDVDADPPAALSRRLVDAPLATGVRAIDGFLTCGVGQRIGIFAPAGVGKSTLIGMIARGCDADVNVIVLVGERGREVREFVENVLGAQGLARSVVIAATSDRSPTERIKAAQVGTAIAEYFRARGQRVLLLVDSLTRLARAQREIGLALGEPPTRRGFPPSVFALLPRLIERAGNDAHGSITAFYSVLTEGADDDDPIAEEVRALVDGHIVLTRALASANHFPAIDMLSSVSRVMRAVASREHVIAASELRLLAARHDEMAILIRAGEVRAGADPLLDRACAVRPHLDQFLRQEVDAPTATLPVTVSQLQRLLA